MHYAAGKLVLHSELFGRIDRRKLERALEVSTLIDERLAAKGVAELYTWAYTDDQYRYNLFMGFKPTGCEVIFENQLPDTHVYEFKKDLI